MPRMLFAPFGGGVGEDVPPSAGSHGSPAAKHGFGLFEAVLLSGLYVMLYRYICLSAIKGCGAAPRCLTVGEPCEPAGADAISEQNNRHT